MEGETDLGSGLSEVNTVELLSKVADTSQSAQFYLMWDSKYQTGTSDLTFSSVGPF